MEIIIFNVCLNLFVYFFGYVLYKIYQESSDTVPKRKEKKKRG